MRVSTPLCTSLWIPGWDRVTHNVVKVRPDTRGDIEGNGGSWERAVSNWVSHEQIKFQREKGPEAFHNCIDTKMNMINGIHSACVRFIVFASGFN